MLLWNQLKAHAAVQPEKPAIVCGDTRLSYAQFAAQAEGVARAWLRQGLRPGDRIALHLRNGIDLATCYYACFAAGFVAVPVNNRLKPEEIAYVLEHSGARAYVAQADLRIPTTIPALEIDPGDGATGDEPVLPAPNADDPALLLYTSGTTARPKGWKAGHRYDSAAQARARIFLTVFACHTPPRLVGTSIAFSLPAISRSERPLTRCSCIMPIAACSAMFATSWRYW